MHDIEGRFVHSYGVIHKVSFLPATLASLNGDFIIHSWAYFAEIREIKMDIVLLYTKPVAPVAQRYLVTL